MSKFNQFMLLKQNRFAPFFVTQFLGAFNDNIFRNGLIILLTFKSIKILGLNASQLANIAGALFILPYFLFSAIAGQLADKHEKSVLIRSVKLLEIGLMLLAGISLLTDNYSYLLVILFLMGFQSALFGPVKYAYIPQKLNSSELIGGNALVESGTYIAIILGLVIGGLAVSSNQDNDYSLAIWLISISILGYFASRKIPTTSATDPNLNINWNIFSEIKKSITYSKKDQKVFLCIIGISWFWFYASAITLQIPAYTLNIINGNELITTLLLATFAIGIGIGSLACEKLSNNQVEIGIIPIGAAGLTIFVLDLYFATPSNNLEQITSISIFLDQPNNWRIIFDLIMIGASGGIFSVPLYANIQKKADKKYLSRIIAANNILNAVFMVSASLLAIITLTSGLSILEFFLLLSIMNIFLSIFLHKSSSEFFNRFCNLIQK